MAKKTHKKYCMMNSFTGELYANNVDYALCVHIRNQFRVRDGANHHLYDIVPQALKDTHIPSRSKHAVALAKALAEKQKPVYKQLTLDI